MPPTPKPLTPVMKSLQAAAAAHQSWGVTLDRTARTAPARAALEQRFLDQGGGDATRAASLRKAYYMRLSAKGAAAAAAARRRRQATQAKGEAS